MSLLSEIASEYHNEILKEKAKELQDAIDKKNWFKVQEIQKWLDVKPLPD